MFYVSSKQPAFFSMRHLVLHCAWVPAVSSFRPSWFEWSLADGFGAQRGYVLHVWDTPFTGT